MSVLNSSSESGFLVPLQSGLHSQASHTDNSNILLQQYNIPEHSLAHANNSCILRRPEFFLRLTRPTCCLYRTEATLRKGFISGPSCICFNQSSKGLPYFCKCLFHPFHLVLEGLQPFFHRGSLPFICRYRMYFGVPFV